MQDRRKSRSALRPELGADEAAQYTRERVFAQVGKAGALRDAPWSPDLSEPATPDYIVDPSASAGYRTLQDAIDQAMRDGVHGPARHLTIGLAKGIHKGPAIVPHLPEAITGLTLVGLGETAGDVGLAASVDAEMPGAEFDRRFGAVFAQSCDEIRALLAHLTARETISTAHAPVLRILGNDVRVFHLTVHNTYNADRGGAGPDAVVNASGQVSKGQHQAVAILTDGADRTVLCGLVLRSFQDTLYLRSPARDETVRTAVVGCDIEGDVDFIFGQSAAHFHRCTIRSLGSRGAKSWVTAPSTHIDLPYGFVFDDCDFVHDGSPLALEGRFSLGRQWFESVRATPYGPAPEGYVCALSDDNLFAPPDRGRVTRATLEAVGKCVILRSRIGAHINPVAPWDDWNSAGYDRDGTPIPSDWNPRYRPFQTCGADYLANLSGWPDAGALDLERVAPDGRFLGEFDNETEGGTTA